MRTLETIHDYHPSAEEIYQALLRSLRRRKGFGIVFIQSSPAQANRLISQLQSDIPQKKFSVLQLTKPIKKLYNLIDEQPDIFFIQGLEKSLESDIRPGYGGEGDYYNLSTVPPVLSHLNQQRENFRDRFSNTCFVFILPLFAIKYFIRRAPDFFDWSSGVFEFSAGGELDRYLDSKIGISNSIQAKIQQELENARIVCSIDDENSGECAAAWDAVEELQAEASYQRQNHLPKNDFVSYGEANPDASEYRVDDSHGDETQFVAEGKQFLESENYHQAIACYDKAILSNPNCLEAWYNRSLALVKLKQYSEAIEGFDCVLQLKPDYSEAWYNRGVVLSKLKRYPEAVDSYTKAIKNEQDYAKAWYNRGVVLSNLNRYSEAIDNYNKALELKPDYPEARNNLSIALVELERYEEAIDSFDFLLELKPDYPEAWYNRGIALRNLGHYKESIDSYNRAIEFKPDFLEAWYNRGLALKNLERYEEAIASYNQAINIACHESNSHYKKACCYGLKGDVKGAVESLQQAITLNPECQQTAKTDSDFDGIRNDNRFQALVQA